MEVLMEVRQLKKYFRIKKGVIHREIKEVKAVDEVSFDIYKGETLGIVGESGCGKSTLGRCLIHLIPKTDGDILFHGVELDTLKKEELRNLKKNMQIIFQDPYGSLNPRFKVREIIEEPLIAHGMKSSEKRREIVEKLLCDVGLGREYMERWPHEFSGGQRQRISIARSLALNPQFIVCDEAVSALDVSTQSQILNLLKDLQKRYGLTYLFISHNLSVVNFISDRVGVMYLGRLVELASVDELYRRSLHPYTEALLSAIPQTDAGLRTEKIVLSGDVPNPSAPPEGCAFHPRCRYCQEICRHERPQMRTIGGTHMVSCHFPLDKKE